MQAKWKLQMTEFLNWRRDPCSKMMNNQITMWEWVYTE